MIILSHPKHTPELANWKERLARMTVPHLLVETKANSPSLKENKSEVHGTEAINQFLGQYEKDVKGWNQDRCDMWFFEEEN